MRPDEKETPLKMFLTLAGAIALGGSLGVAGLLAASAPSFAAPKTYGVGTNPSSVAISDLNGDGKADLATANRVSNTVSVVLNKGHGIFQPRVDYQAGTNPYSIAAGDLNGDGKADLATANALTESGTVSVLINRGNGTFAPGRDYTTEGDTRAVAIGDLNGDGKPDLAAVDYLASRVSLLLNRGDGTFALGFAHVTGRGPHSLAIGDVNGDGKLDLATANQGLFGSTVSVLLNSGNGDFQGKFDYGTGGNPGGIAIGDLNGDGKPELATANSGADTVSVLANGGDGTFATRRDYATGRVPLSAAIGDLNADGKPDLVTGNNDAGSVSVLTNAGDGSFQARVDQADPGADIRSVAIGDLNGDSRPDLATADGETNDVSVFTNTTGVCKVPNIKGKKLPAAKRAIAGAHCRVGKIRRAYSKTVKRGRVVSEKPKPGTVLLSGKVDLVVSRGRSPS
jgi:hypothetical protein